MRSAALFIVVLGSCVAPLAAQVRLGNPETAPTEATAIPMPTVIVPTHSERPPEPRLMPAEFPEPYLPLPFYLQNLALFGGFDGSRAPDDLGINANIGGRLGLQTGLPLIESAGLGLQLGIAGSYHRTATQFLRLNDEPGERSQIFSTLGILQRTDWGLSWALAYDYAHTQSYSTLDLGQWRGQISLQVMPTLEVGVWGTYRDRADSATVAGETFHLQAINQTNLFFRYTWPTQAVTSFWIGLAQEHGQAVLGIPGDVPIRNVFVYGADAHIPLSQRVALYGEANFITPNDTGTVTAFLGLVFYPGGNAASAGRNPFAPVLPLANNPNFSFDARRN